MTDMNILLDEALADPNFHPQKFINILANSKDAATLLSQYHKKLTEFIEQSNERIVNSFSKNHTVIMNAARDANLIESEIKDLQNLLIDQSKFISEISTTPQVFSSSETSILSYISNSIHLDSSVNSFLNDSQENKERILQINKLIKTLDVARITRKYIDIPQIINNIERIIQNLNPRLQYDYKSSINLKISEICQQIVNLILNINPIFLSDNFSIKSLLGILVNLKQHDLALKIYLEVKFNNLNSKIHNFQCDAKNSLHIFKTILIKDFIDELSNIYIYISDIFDQINLRIIFYKSTQDMIKSIIKYFIVQASLYFTPFIDLCEYLEQILIKVKENKYQFNFDMYKLFKNTINCQIEPFLALYVSNHYHEIENLFNNHQNIKFNSSLINDNQMEILKIENSLTLCTEENVIPAIVYFNVVYGLIFKKILPVVKSKTFMRHQEKYFLLCINQMAKILKKSHLPSNELNNSLEHLKNIILKFKKKFPKSNFFSDNNNTLKSIYPNI